MSMDRADELKERMESQGYRQVGRSTPGGPGDIYVSEAVLAQLGEAAVRSEVRGIYRAAYAAKDRP